MHHATRVVVLGAGYGGLMAAMRLAKKTRPDVAITIVNAGDSFQERVRNHQSAAGQAVGRYPLASLLRGTRIELVQAVVTDLDPSSRRVIMRRGGDNAAEQVVRYDYLVYALGSSGRRSAAPGVRGHAYTLDHPSVTALAARLPELARRRRPVVVVGGGPTGVELATELAETYPGAKVALLTRREVVPRFSPRARAYVRAALARLGIELVEHAEVAEVGLDTALVRDGRRFPFDACVWTGGFGVSDLARRAGLRVNDRGQILIDRTMRSLSHPEIYAVGDAAMPAEAPGAPVRMSLVTALMMGAHGADSLAAHLNGTRPMAFGMSYSAAGISLGRRDGVVQFLDGSRDTPLAYIFTGRLAAGVREFFVRLALSLIKAQRTAPWVFEWPGRRKMRHVAVVAAARPSEPVVRPASTVPVGGR